MSAVFLKSVNHVYQIFKVYLTVALCGALGVLFVQIILVTPMPLLVAICGGIVLMIAFLLWFQTPTSPQSSSKS